MFVIFCGVIYNANHLQYLQKQIFFNADWEGKKEDFNLILDFSWLGQTCQDLGKILRRIPRLSDPFNCAENGMKRKLKAFRTSVKSLR